MSHYKCCITTVCFNDNSTRRYQSQALIKKKPATDTNVTISDNNVQLGVVDIYPKFGDIITVTILTYT